MLSLAPGSYTPGFFVPSSIHTGMWTIETITPAATSPVSTADMRAHLRLNDTSENTLLDDWVTAASDLFTRHTGYVLITSTFRLKLDDWQDGNAMWVPRHPVSAISSVQYLDTAGTWQTVSTSDYSTDLTGSVARITFASTYTFPTLHDTQRPRVRVQFVAGNANAAACPRLALAAVKLLASHWYTQREAYGEADLSETPAGWRAVCEQYRTHYQGEWQ